jgi:probable rRNA maturation factor
MIDERINESVRTNTVDLSFMNIEPDEWLKNTEEIAYRVLDALGIKNWEVSIVLCDDAFITGLNKKYRNKPEPTDVLSFPQSGVGEAGDMIFPQYTQSDKTTGAGKNTGNNIIASNNIIAGDIVISLPALERNAALSGADKNEELIRLIVHGILHLKGMDHEGEECGGGMLFVQEKIIKTITGGKP